MKPRSIEYLLEQAQRSAPSPTRGPHLLRHTGLARLANLGASVHVVQAVARARSGEKPSGSPDCSQATNSSW